MIGHVMIFRDPDVKFVFGEIGDVAGQSGRVVMHGLAHQDPAHVGPPLAVARRMRIAILIGVAMVNAVRGHPENRAALERERGANGEEVLKPLGNFVAADG